MTTPSTTQQVEDYKVLIYRDLTRRIETAQQKGKEFVQLYGTDLIWCGHLLQRDGYRVDYKLNRIYAKSEAPE